MTSPWLPKWRCALVSTSGELLTKRDGGKIDQHQLVARLGQAPLGEARKPHVGSRTNVRFITGSFFKLNATRKVNVPALHAILDAMDPENSEVVFLVMKREYKSWPQLAGCPPPIPPFMRRHPGLPYRCTTSLDAVACNWPSALLPPSSGALAISVLFGLFRCKTIRLFGFANTDRSLPYHYWSDGSVHDGMTTAQWYQSRASLGLHKFDHEHRLMHDVLGGCSWVLRADRYRNACSTRFTGAAAAALSCAARQDARWPKPRARRAILDATPWSHGRK